MPDVDTAGWIQAGGVVAFATAVLWEIRAMRPVLQSIKEVLSALLERERIRNERARRESGQRHDEWREDETTDLKALIDAQRRGRRPATPPHGVRSPRPGSHHDGEG